MGKKFELDRELDLLLDEQLIREAELLEKELFADKNKELYTETEKETQDSYERLVARLKADGVYQEDETTEKSVNKVGVSKKLGPTQRSFGRGKKLSARRDILTDEQKHRRRRRISAKIAGVIVVSGMCVFTATMTSEANRHYIINSMKIMTGRDTRVVNDNDETNEMLNKDEYAAIAEIEEKLGIEVPEFYYRPNKFLFNSYGVDAIAEIAWMEYECEDGFIMLYMNKSRDDSTSNISGMIGEEVRNIKMQYDDTDVSIVQIEDTDDATYGYYAKWKRNNINYSVNGRIELEELIEIVKKLAY